MVDYFNLLLEDDSNLLQETNYLILLEIQTYLATQGKRLILVNDNGPYTFRSTKSNLTLTKQTKFTIMGV